MAGGQRGGEPGGALGLDAEDPHGRHDAFDRQGHAGDQPAAADRHDDRLDVGHLLENLQAHGPLPRDDRRIVEAVDVGQPRARGQLAGVFVGFAERFAVQHDLGPQPSAGGALDQAAHTWA